MTSSVAAWLAGSRVNNGWIVLPTGGSNGVGVQLTNALNPTLTPYLDFDPLTPPSAPPSPTRPPPPPAFSYVFNGENSSYTGGCQSTKIASDNVDYNGAQQTTVEWDGSSITSHFDSALVQFPDIIGSGPYQLRPHEQIQRATLRYYVDLVWSTDATGATAQLHEISKEWNATSTTFHTFAGAQGLNEAEYRTPAIATAFANPRAGWYAIDVTASVQSWVNGASTNNGWIWLPSPQNLGGSGDGSSMRACNAPPDRRVNLVVFAALQPPRPPSPPARPPPPPPPPSPPPSPPRAPFTVMQIRNAQHALLRMVAPTTNYATATEVFWDGNSACASGAQNSLATWSAQLHQLLLPTASSDVDALLFSHVCVPLLP